jgi:hypothetical protein
MRDKVQQLGNFCLKRMGLFGHRKKSTIQKSEIQKHKESAI